MNAIRTFSLASMLLATASACGRPPEPAVAPPTTAMAPAPASTAASPAAPPGAPVASNAASSASAPGAAIDPARVGALTGGKSETADNVVRVTFPREDVRVSVDGWNKVAPFMGLTSWTAFVPGEKPGVEAMVMGDLV